MEMGLIIFRQTLVMFLYMFAGFALYQSGKITAKGSKELASLLLWLIIPAVMINSFCMDFSLEKLMEFLQSTLLGGLSLLLSMAVARLLFRNAPIDQFAAAFSNAGFIGIPLVQAAIGPDAVFYLVGMIALLNMLQWTYGVGILTGEKSATSPKNILLNPIMAGVAIGLALFLTGWGVRLPEVVSTTLKGLSAMNAPMAMLVLGTYLAQSDWKAMFAKGKLYWTGIVRLLVIPVLTLLIFRLIPLPDDMRLTLFIASSAPIGANVAVYVQLHDMDYPYACQTVALSTLLSIITLPLLMIAAEWVL